VIVHAQEMETEVIDAHINLYVNEFSISLGEVGRRAVEKVFAKSAKNYKNIFL
jgi:1,4-dihydroxy-6-naphthoate synthase